MIASFSIVVLGGEKNTQVWPNPPTVEGEIEAINKAIKKGKADNNDNDDPC
jgi:hypothetical protein